MIENKPFGHHFESTTLPAYAAEVVKLLSFVLRSHSMVLPSRVAQPLQSLQDALLGEDDVEEELVHEVCLAMWTTEWDEDSSVAVPDPTLRFIALSSLKPQGHFNKPTQITPLIAKMEYMIRLSVVYEIHRLRLTTTASSHALSQRFSCWLTQDQVSTFGSLYMLQHLASSIAYSTMAPSKVFWPEANNHRRMLFEGKPIAMDDVTKMLDDMECDLVQIWEEKVLLGMDLRVKYDSLVDNISNNDPGYSFFSDSRNPCFNELCSLLHDAIVRHPEHSQRFLRGHTSGSEPIWNLMELRRWLIAYAQFEEVLLTKSELTAGASARGTEITTLVWKNTVLRPTRGLFMMGRHLAYLCQYHKGASVTLREKTIPHAFDAHTSDLIVQHLAIARPFAQFAAYLCFPDQPQVHVVYDWNLFANFGKAFTTNDITTRLQNYSQKWLGVRIGMQEWRHISIGFRRKLCTAMEQVNEEDQDETVGALQSHHSRMTENRIYGISSMALLSGQADDVFPLYLEHSTDWQEVCGVAKGGSLKPYRESMARDVVAAAPPAPAATTGLANELLAVLMPALTQVVEAAVSKHLKLVCSFF